MELKIQQKNENKFPCIFPKIFQVKKINIKNILPEEVSIRKKKEHILSEINLFLKLSKYNNILKYIGFYEDNDTQINLVFEKPEINLKTYLLKKGKLEISEIKNIFNQLNNILKVFQKEKIIHGNINLENIYLKFINKTNYIVKLNICSLEPNKILCLNDYINFNQNDVEIYTKAPEILLHNKKSDSKIDLFSIGAILYKLYFICSPFGDSYHDITSKVFNNHFNIQESDDDFFNDLYFKLLQFNPMNRINWSSYFAHPFFDNSPFKFKIKTNVFNVTYKDNTEMDLNEKNLEFFNNKYDKNLNIEDEEINLGWDGLGDEGFVYLTKITFPELTKLHMNNNQLKTLTPLTNSNFPKLNYFYFFNNYLKSIDVLSNCNFPFLVEIKLFSNYINNIDVLALCNFQNLQILDLGKNQINKIDTLASCNFPKLKVLDLNSNKINRISLLNKCNFPELNTLNLSNNLIMNINNLNTCLFPKLSSLNLGENKIYDIYVLASCNFPELAELNLYSNQIRGIYVLEKCKFPLLKVLDLYNNKIENIDVLCKCNFPLLNKIYICDNKILNTNVIAELKEKHVNVFFKYS